MSTESSVEDRWGNGEVVAASVGELAIEVDRLLDHRTRKILDRRRSRGHHRRGWIVRRLLLAGDLAGLAAAFALTELAFLPQGEDSSWVHPTTELLLLVVALLVWPPAAKLYGLYAGDEERTDHSTVDDLVGVFHLVTVQVWLTYAAAWTTGLAQPHLSKTLAFWALAIAMITVGRATARKLARSGLTYFQNTVIVGTGEVGRLIAHKYLKHPEYGINLIGFVDADPFELEPELRDIPVLGSPVALPKIVRVLDVERVVVAFSRDSHENTLDVISLLKDLDVQVDIVPRLFEVLGPNMDVHTVEGLALIGLPPLHLSRSSLLVKRTIDVCAAAFGIFVLAPVMLLIALAIKLDSPGPVLYLGQRIGSEGSRFRLFKFRTMRRELCRGPGYGAEEAEAAFAELMTDPALRGEFERTHKLSDDPRVTRVGRFLRRTSLDELPQLLNVLFGDLSLVGPRPITEHEYEILRSRPAPELNGDNGLGDAVGLARSRRLRGYWEIARLRPGLTGYWQIAGRSGIDFRERTRLDMAYVTGWSVKLDLVICAKTLRALLLSRGAY